MQCPQVKKGWQAFDMLDEAWCPIVQVHGLFDDIREPLRGGLQCGLLMELYGVSLYDVLQEKQHEHVLKRLNIKELKPFHNKERITVAHNVASACRYLHDLGMLHRDLKDQNVLVDPENGYRAKLTDFGAPRTRVPVAQHTFHAGLVRKLQAHRETRARSSSASLWAPRTRWRRRR